MLIPRALNELGLEAVVAALPDLEGKLVQPLDGYWLALYPYIEGENAMQKGLNPAQWQEYGSFVRALHTARLPRALKDSLPRERFQPAWAGMVRRIQAGRCRVGGFLAGARS